MDALVFSVAPIVDVTMDVGFNPFAWADDVPEFPGIDQSTRKMQRITTESRVVMGNDNRRLALEPIECVCQPAQLIFANGSLGHHGFL